MMGPASSWLHLISTRQRPGLSVNHWPLSSACLLSVQNSRWLLECPSHDPSCTAPGCPLLKHSEGKKDAQEALPIAAVRIQGETRIPIPPPRHWYCSSCFLHSLLSVPEQGQVPQWIAIQYRAPSGLPHR